MSVPNTFASATTSIPLANLDANFAYYDAAFAISGSAVTFAGSITLTTGTANGVAYLDGSKVLTTGSALTFDGVQLTNSQNSNSGTYIVNRNVNTSTAATAYVISDATAAFSGYTAMGSRSSGYTTSGMLEANSGGVFSVGMTNGLNIMTLDGYPVKFGVANAEAMRLTSTGLGIGTSSPSEKLHVQGKIRSANVGNTVYTQIENDGVYATGTALYLLAPASQFMAFYADSAEKMRLTSSGNLGIGTSSPANYANYTTLTIQAPAGGTGAEIDLKNSSGTTVGAIYTNATDFVISSDFNSAIAGSVLRFDVDGTERMRLDSSGNLMVGATSSSAIANKNIDVNGTGDAAFVLRVGGTTTSYLYSTAGTTILGTATSIPLVFQTAGAEKMRLDSSGNLLVGTTSSYGGERVTIDFTGSSQRGVVVRNTTSTTQDSIAFVVNSTFVGWISASTTATSYNTISDHRLKANVVPMTGALATVAKLKPVTYKWKLDGSDGQGFIAHELAEVCPQAVSGEKDAVNEDGSIKSQGIDTSFLVATLTAAIQEQQALITQLTARVAQLESKP